MRLAETFLFGKAEIDSARNTFEKMPLEPPEIYPVFLDMADGKYDSALERATQLTGRDKGYWQAECFTLMGRTEEATRLYEAELARVNGTLTDEPDNVIYLYRRGMVLASLGRKEAAIRDGRTALGLLPPSKDAFATDLMHTLVGIYLRVGEIDAALDQIEFILSNPSKYSSRHFRSMLARYELADHPRFEALEKRFGL